MTWITATYRIRAPRAQLDDFARGLALEQSVELSDAAVTDAFVRERVMGRVAAIRPGAADVHDVDLHLATVTTGLDVAQTLNMLFGNASLHPNVALVDVVFPPEVTAEFQGPRFGIAGVRARLGVADRPLSCAALKPQGLSSEALAALCYTLAVNGVDVVKDDHGLADQAYSPFAERVAAIAGSVGRTRYVPSLSGDLDTMRRQIDVACTHGIDAVLIAPMLAGWATMQTVVRQYPDVAFFAHPTMGGAARIAPDLLIGKLFRLLGADAVIFPNHGGRFGYTPETCRRLADRARAAWDGIRPCVPVPAGGMTLERVPEMLDFYGPDAMLLIGGSLLAARERLTEETAAFTRAVAQHSYR